MAHQNVSPRFFRWGIESGFFSTPPAVNWPDKNSSMGINYYHSTYAGPQGPTAYPAVAGMFSPHNVLKPSRDTVDIKAYVWWAVDATTLGAPVLTRTNVMFGAQMNTVCNGGPSFTNYTPAPFYPYADIYQDESGIVPAGRVPAAIIASTYPVDPNNSLANAQTLTRMIVPQTAMSMHTFLPGETICGVYQDPLYFIYKDANDVVRTDATLSFKKFEDTTDGLKLSITPSGTIWLTATGPQRAGNPLSLWRLNAGLPPVGYFAAGFDLDGDGSKEVDNYAAPVTVYGIELNIL